MSTHSPRTLHLGDSYTIGTGVDLADSFPHQLVRRLRTFDQPLTDPTIIAKNGWTCADLTAALADLSHTALLTPPYDLVTLLIGVNDQYAGHPLADYAPAFTHLLNAAITFAGNQPRRVIVIAIPDYAVTPFAIEKAFTAPNRDTNRIHLELAAYNSINRHLAQQGGAHYVDITPISRLAGLNPAALLAPDGLHPSAEHYARWCDLLTPTAHTILTNPTG